MKYYAIQRKADGMLITGTDFRYQIPRQLVELSLPPLLFTGYTLETEVKRREINTKKYQVVTIEIDTSTADKMNAEEIDVFCKAHREDLERTYGI